MKEEEFVFGTTSEKEYISTITDKEEKLEIGWEIRRRIGFLKRLSPEVKKYFLDNYNIEDTNRQTLERLDYPNTLEYDTKKPIYYVYENYTCDDNKIYYIGFSKDFNIEHTHSRDKRVALLSEKKGIATRIIVDGLTQYEALVYVITHSKVCIKRGEQLLNWQHDNSKSNLETEISMHNGCPFIYKDLFVKRYFEKDYQEEQQFDEVTDDSLSCVFFYANQKKAIVKWLYDKNARIMRSNAKSVKSIIVGPYITYYDYIKYRKDNKRILSEKDVLEYIDNNLEHPLFYIDRKCSKAGKQDIKRRDYIRQYLNDNSNTIEEYFQYMRNNNFPVRDLQEPFLTSILQGVKPVEKYYAEIQYLLMWKTSYLQKGSAHRLIDIYLKYGMYEEALPLLEINDNRAADYYYYKELAEM